MSMLLKKQCQCINNQNNFYFAIERRKLMQVALIFRILSIFCMFIGSLLAYGFILKKIGFIWGTLAMIFFPVTAAVAPWYEGFVLDQWIPLILIYGGAASACIFGAVEDKAY